MALAPARSRKYFSSRRGFPAALCVRKASTLNAPAASISRLYAALSSIVQPSTSPRVAYRKMPPPVTPEHRATVELTAATDAPAETAVRVDVPASWLAALALPDSSLRASAELRARSAATRLASTALPAALVRAHSDGLAASAAMGVPVLAITSPPTTQLRLLQQTIKEQSAELHGLMGSTANLETLRNEVYQLQRELLQERTKVRALSEELENPMNVHRWRKLEGSDPSTYSMIQRSHALQKQLIRKTEEVAAKDALVQQKDFPLLFDP